MQYSYKSLIFRYTLSSFFATAVDWTIFHLLTNYLGLFYQWALFISMVCGTFVSYVCNKRYAFRCHSSKIGVQLIAALLISVSAIGLSMLLMALWVEAFHFGVFSSRALTTIVIFFWNFLLSRYITFCRRFFK